MPPDTRHPCPEPGCGKAFSSSSHLRRHARNHRNDRAFTCKHCGQSFVRREVWKRHEALHVTPQSVRPRIKPVGAGESSLSPGAGAIKYEKYEPKYDNDDEGTPEPLSSLRRASRLEPALTPRISDERSHSRAESVLPLVGPSALGMDAVPQIQPMQQQQQQHQQHQQQQHWASLPVGATQTPEPQASFADIVPTSVYYPSGGASLESWINQILTEQSTFPTFDQPVPPPELPATAFLWDQRGAVESPSAQDAGACSRLRNWLMDKNASQLPIEITTDRMTRCLAAYWATIDPQIPIVHRPTFSSVECSPLVLLSMVILGATVAGSEDDWAWAGAVLPQARVMAMTCNMGNPTDRMHALQSMVMLSLVGHGMGADEQDHAHGIMSMALTLARRANMYQDRPRRPAISQSDLQAQWSQWIIEESTQRACWVIMFRDIEYCSFFQQLPTRAYSPFRTPCPLPCPESCWDAPTPEAWSHAFTPGETLAANLKRILISGPAGPTLAFGKGDELFKQLNLTYCLSALGWDANNRDLIASEVSKSNPQTLTVFLIRILSHAAMQDPEDMGRNSKRSCLQGSIQDVAFLAALDLHLSTLFLQVFAGVPEVGILQPVRPTDQIDANKSMRAWAISPSSRDAVILSTQFLMRAIETGQAHTLNHAWAIYMACLVCWAYYVLRRVGSVPPHMQQTDGQNTKDDALQFCYELENWARGEDHEAREPSPLLMRALSTQVVLLLSTRKEVMVKAACLLVDRNVAP
ncbi:hypothetical protein Q8F55_007459 [Vanrija albida]|uniref:C2H2-type domain-containing protein n=1 Tax=Vanrija albida TaxID=181172 RepID=A0ABR3PUK5_9TREE